MGLWGDRYDYMSQQDIDKEIFMEKLWTIVKWIIIASFIIAACIGAWKGCSELRQADEARYQKWYDVNIAGDHKLMRFRLQENTTSRWGGMFFLVAGGGSGGTTTQTRVRFAWQQNNGEYMISSVPIEKIHVVLNEDMTVPIVRFTVKESNDGCGCGRPPHNEEVGQEFIDDWVSKVTVTCTSAQWPMDVSGLKQL